MSSASLSYMAAAVEDEDEDQAASRWHGASAGSTGACDGCAQLDAFSQPVAAEHGACAAEQDDEDAASECLEELRLPECAWLEWP